MASGGSDRPRLTNRDIVTKFIRSRLAKAGIDESGIEELLPFQLSVRHERIPVVAHMLVIAERLDNNAQQLNSMRDSLRLLRLYEPDARDSYNRIIDHVFNDGVNFGRIATVIIFSSMAVIQAIQDNQNQRAMELIDWCVSMLSRPEVAAYIESRGGWEGMPRLPPDPENAPELPNVQEELAELGEHVRDAMEGSMESLFMIVLGVAGTIAAGLNVLNRQ